jgi:hypothetical protein
MPLAGRPADGSYGAATSQTTTTQAQDPPAGEPAAIAAARVMSPYPRGPFAVSPCAFFLRSTLRRPAVTGILLSG